MRILPRSCFQACFAAAAAAALAAPAKPLAEPAKIDVRVSPDKQAPGSQAQVVVQLHPAAGVKINRYPKIKLTVDDAQGLLHGGTSAVGNDAPPPPEKMESNYFAQVEPVELRLELDRAAAPGAHVVEGKLSYFYCVAASGFCAPARTTIKIPLTVQ
ncbi:MAG TPA: hypothetical protein VJS92_10395 [Candidatus Polarisedimenticolaceae bacterium]|nr:hypothetical protein [Candidatus Polarisedimenticolaceae bacterium]